MIFDVLINKMILNYMSRYGAKGLEELEKESHNAVEVSESLLMKLLDDNKDTEYGRKYSFDKIHNVEDFKRMVPFSTYDDYEPYIRKMVNDNARDLICCSAKHDTVHYALSSGSVGVPKHIPVSQETINIYSQYAASRAYATADRYSMEKFGRKFPRGKGLNLVEIKLVKTPCGIFKGPISGAAVYSKRKFLKYIFTSPEEILIPTETMDMKYMKLRFSLIHRDVVYITAAFMTAVVDLMNYLRDNWELLCDDIENGTIDSRVLCPTEMRARLERKLKPDKKRADELRAIFKEGFDTPVINKIWPEFSWIGAIGTGGFTKYTEKIRKMVDNNVFIDFLTYAASESLMAVAVAAEEQDFVIIPRACYFEFIPADSDDETTTYGINELEIGKLYEVVLTNLSGFYRYKIKDVVRVTGYYYDLPRIEFVYRKSQMISIAGEKTNEESVKYAINEFEKETGQNIMNYTIYADTDCEPGRYVVCIEPEKMMDINLLPKYRDILEEKLGYANPSYGAKVKEGVLSPMVVHFSQIETHAAYRDMMIMKGVSENQLKPVRVLDTPRKEGFFLTMIEDESSLKK